VPTASDERKFQEWQEETRKRTKGQLENAIYKNNKEDAAEALRLGAASYVDRDALALFCVTEGHFAMLKVLLSAPKFVTKKINGRCTKGRADRTPEGLMTWSAEDLLIPITGETPLHYAARIDDIDLVQLLLNNEADCNVTDASLLQTPLHYAIKAKRVAIIEMLLKARALVDPKDAKGLTPAFLFLADKCRQCLHCSVILKLLIKYLCDFSQLKEPFHMLIQHKDCCNDHHMLRLAAFAQYLGTRQSQERYPLRHFIAKLYQ